MNIKKAIIGTTLVISFLFSASSAFAHVVVKPNQVGVAVFQTFTVGVPNEKNNPTVAVRLVIPEGLKSVSPNVKPGWHIDIKRTGEGENSKVTEISWTGGAIPQGQRDEFLFSAQVPAEETTLVWKAYQTYEDGEVVAWDQKSSGGHDDGIHPYSETKIVNDLKASSAETVTHKETQKKDSVKENLPIFFSVAALGFSVAAFMQNRRKK